MLYIVITVAVDFNYKKKFELNLLAEEKSETPKSNKNN
jgi:hypothetical protein